MAWRFARMPHSYLDRLLGIGITGNWGTWLLQQGTVAAVVAAALAVLLVSSPVSRRMLLLFAVPFTFGLVMYVGSLVNPPPPALVSNAVAFAPLVLMLVPAMALSLGLGRGHGPGAAGFPAPPEGA